MVQNDRLSVTLSEAKGLVPVYKGILHCVQNDTHLVQEVTCLRQI